MLKKRLTIIGVLAVSFFIASLINQSVFYNNTPKVSPDFIAKIAGNAQNIAMTFSPPKNAKSVAVKYETANGIVKNTQLASPPNVSFMPLTKGVAASEVQPNGQTFVKVDGDHQIKVRRFQLKDGRVIDILDLTGQ